MEQTGSPFTGSSNGPPASAPAQPVDTRRTGLRSTRWAYGGAVIGAAGVVGAVIALWGGSPAAAEQPWQKDRSHLPVDATPPSVDCGTGGVSSGTFDYAGGAWEDELDPLERARAIRQLDGVEGDPASATWVDVDQTSGAVTMTTDEGAVGMVVHFERSAEGWYATGMDACEPSTS
jgi:hypothetical protein